MSQVLRTVSLNIRRIPHKLGPAGSVSLLIAALIFPATAHAVDANSTPIFFQNNSTDINSANPDGSGVTSYGQGKYPSLSPNGQKIVYASQDSAVVNCNNPKRHNPTEIFTMNPDGSGKSDLTSQYNMCVSVMPAWSPDDSKIAFESDGGFLYVINADGTNLQQLPEQGDNPAWSPDGTKIAYVSSQANGGIEVMNADGTNSTEIVASGANPSWSSDGNSIAYTDWNLQTIYTANPDGTNPTAIYNVPAGSGGGLGEFDTLSWSPDSSTLAFDQFIPAQGSSYGLYTIPATGGSPAEIVPGSDSTEVDTVAWALTTPQLQTATAPTITSPALFQVNAREPLNFTVTTTGNPTATITESGSLPTGVTFRDNGDGTATFDGQASPVNNGYYFITITASNSAGISSQNFVLAVNNAKTAPTFLSADNLTVASGSPFSFSIDTTGNPLPNITKSGNLPKGVDFNDNNDGTATISGTPTGKKAVGTYPLTLKAKNKNGTITQAFTLTVT